MSQCNNCLANKVCDHNRYGFENCENYISAADVVPSIELYNELYGFKNDLVNTFIDLCRGNDYNKLTLLKIGDTIDALYDKHIADLKKKYTEGEE